MKKVLLIFICLFLSNCSYQFVNPYNRFSSKSCTKNYAAPILDATLSLFIGIPSLYFTGITISEPKSQFLGNLPYVISGALLFTTYKFASSMTYGNREVEKCRKFNL